MCHCRHEAGGGTCRRLSRHWLGGQNGSGDDAQRGNINIQGKTQSPLPHCCLTSNRMVALNASIITIKFINGSQNRTRLQIQVGEGQLQALALNTSNHTCTSSLDNRPPKCLTTHHLHPQNHPQVSRHQRLF